MNTLEQYRDYFQSLRASKLKVIEHKNYGVNYLTTTVVHRDPPFQAELIIAGPDTKFSAHRHPHIVDSYGMHIAGDLRFIIADTPEEVNRLLEISRPFPEKVIFAKCPMLRIRSIDWHGVVVGKTGASFWSVQQWSDNNFVSVKEDWEDPITA